MLEYCLGIFGMHQWVLMAFNVGYSRTMGFRQKSNCQAFKDYLMISMDFHSIGPLPFLFLAPPDPSQNLTIFRVVQDLLVTLENNPL